MTTSQLVFLAPIVILVLWMVFSHGGRRGGGHGMGGCGGGHGHAGHGGTSGTKQKSPDHDHGTGTTKRAGDPRRASCSGRRAHSRDGRPPRTSLARHIRLNII